MIRVLLDCRMVSWSGVGRYTTGLARAIAARADVELIQVCAPGDSPPAPPGFLVRTAIATASPFSLRGAMELGRIAIKLEPDLVHCPHFPAPLPVQIPLVVTLQDLIPLVIPDSMPSLAKRTIYRLWNARAVSAADRIITPSRATAHDVAEFFPAAQDRLVVTPYAADDFSSGPSRQPTDALAQSISSNYLLSMGNTRAHKDVPVLLKAFGILAPSFPDLRLLLVGPEPPGYLRTQLKGVPAEISSRIAFTGRVDDDDLRALYEGATVFVCPSRYEGFGFPALEAMALGAPVVCSDSASLPEVVGQAALVFPAGEQGLLATAITRLLRDPHLRRKLVEQGRSHTARFTWAKTAAATVAVYTFVLQGRDASSLGWEAEEVGPPDADSLDASPAEAGPPGASPLGPRQGES